MIERNISSIQEWMGTGTRDMIRSCNDVDLPEPVFAVSDGFQTIIRRIKSGEETSREPSVKSSVKPSVKTSGLILDIIRRQPEITIPEMAESLGKSTRAIELQLAKLKKSGKVQRIGPAKGGHWEIIEGGDE